MMQFLVAAPCSGSGKTTLTCALLAALKRRGADPCAFKSGPDYIDPMFHRAVLGVESHNLDLFFSAPDTVRALYAQGAAGHGAAVCEGAMGFYDGLGGVTDTASAWHLADTLGLPVLLVVPAKGASLTLAAQINGLKTFRTPSRIVGVLLNDCTSALYKMLKPMLERETGLPVLGHLPRLPEASIESRHLGLVTAGEIRDLREKMQTLAAQAEKTLDIDALLALAHEAEPLDYTPAVLPKKEKIRLAVARDNAFCFYYEDSLDAVREMGGELVPFSPITDGALPENIDGLYLGGGYPELYAKELGENASMRASVRAALERGVPCIAECGGFMYLTEAIGDEPMAGFLPGTCFDTGKLTRFGYVTLRAKKDNLLCRAGGEIAAHEFHHWDCTCPGDAFAAEKPTGRRWECAAASDTLYAGYPHFHFYSNLEFLYSFYDACIKEKHRHDGKH